MVPRSVNTCTNRWGRAEGRNFPTDEDLLSELGHCGPLVIHSPFSFHFANKNCTRASKWLTSPESITYSRPRKLRVWQNIPWILETSSILAKQSLGISLRPSSFSHKSAGSQTTINEFCGACSASLSHYIQSPKLTSPSAQSVSRPERSLLYPEQPWSGAEQATEELARPGSGPTRACFWALQLGRNCSLYLISVSVKPAVWGLATSLETLLLMTDL